VAVRHLRVGEECFVLVRPNEQKLSGTRVSAGDCCEVAVGMPREVENVAVFGDAERLSLLRFEGLPINLMQNGNSLVIGV